MFVGGLAVELAGSFYFLYDFFDQTGASTYKGDIDFGRLAIPMGSMFGGVIVYLVGLMTMSNQPKLLLTTIDIINSPVPGKVRIL